MISKVFQQFRLSHEHSALGIRGGSDGCAACDCGSCGCAKLQRSDEESGGVDKIGIDQRRGQPTMAVLSFDGYSLGEDVRMQHISQFVPSWIKKTV